MDLGTICQLMEIDEDEIGDNEQIVIALQAIYFIGHKKQYPELFSKMKKMVEQSFSLT